MRQPIQHTAGIGRWDRQGTRVDVATAFFETAFFKYAFHRTTFFAAALCLVACDGCSRGPDPEPTGQAEPAAPEAPDLTAHFCVDTMALAAIRDRVGGPIAEVFPENAPQFIVTQLGPLAGAAAVAEDSKVCGLVVGDEVLLASERRTDGPGAVQDTMRFGEVLVFGRAHAQEMGAEYLARVLFAQELTSPLSFHVDEQLIAGQRRRLERALSEQHAAGRAAIEAERARHGESPTFGDPDVALDLLIRHIGRLVEYLPDVGDADGELIAEDGNLLIQLRAQVEEDSPLAAALAGQDQAPSEFGSLPLGAALAYMRASEGRTELSSSLLEVAGARASSSEGERIRSAANMMRPPFTLTIGAESAPWLTYRGALPDEEPLRAALGGPYVRALLGGLFGCPRVDAVWPAEGDRPGARCSRPPLSIASDSFTLGSHSGSDVSESPDVVRLIDRDEPVMGAIYVDPLRLPAALSLFAFAPPREAPAGGPSPVLFTWQHREGQLVLKLRFAPEALSQLALIGAAFGAD